jgi:hypothetical protein
MNPGVRPGSLGAPWLALYAALALHIVDESLTGFLAVYNPTVVSLRQRWAWFPMPPFEVREWLIGLIAACAILICLAPLAFRGARWLRPLAWIFAAIMLLNSLGHTLATVLGRTIESVFASSAGILFFPVAAGGIPLDDAASARNRSAMKSPLCYHRNSLCISKKKKTKSFRTFPGQGRRSWMCQEFPRSDRAATKTLHWT